MANTAVVYGREYEGKELNFEASGALWDASLVMRDRETDSWWSIMTSAAVGGELDGTDLAVLPLGEKAMWSDWVARHPDTLVLSVDGREHEPDNPYDDYFASDGTFRNIKVQDKRLAAKQPIFTFRAGDTAYAVPHGTFDGGRLFEVEELGGRSVLLIREAGSSMFESSRAWIIAADLAELETDTLVARAVAGEEGIEPLGGFDTFWYNWVTINKDSKLLR